MSPLAIVLLVVLVLLLVGSFPVFPWTVGYGYRPTGVVGILLIVLIVLMLTGHL